MEAKSQFRRFWKSFYTTGSKNYSPTEYRYYDHYIYIDDYKLAAYDLIHLLSFWVI